MILIGPIDIRLGSVRIDQEILDHYAYRKRDAFVNIAMDGHEWGDEELLRAALYIGTPMILTAERPTVLHAEIARFPYCIAWEADNIIYKRHTSYIYALRFAPITGGITQITADRSQDTTVDSLNCSPEKMELTIGRGLMHVIVHFLPPANLTEILPPDSFVSEIIIRDEDSYNY